MNFCALDLETESLVPDHPEYALQPFRMQNGEMRITSMCVGDAQGKYSVSSPSKGLLCVPSGGEYVWTWNGIFDIGCLIAAGVDCSKVRWLDAMSAMKWIYRSQKTDPPYENAKRYSWSLANGVKDCLKDWEHYDEFLEIKKEVPKDAGPASDEVSIFSDKLSAKNYWLRRCKLDTEATLLLGTQFWDKMQVRQRRGFLIEQGSLFPAAQSWIRGKLYDFEAAKRLKTQLEKERADILIALMRQRLLPFSIEKSEKTLASPQQCAELLYDTWQVPFEPEHCYTKKGARSVGKTAMTFLIEKHIHRFPALQLVSDYRGMKSKFDKFINGPTKARKYLGSDYMHHQLRVNSTYTGRCTVSSKSKG